MAPRTAIHAEPRPAGDGVTETFCSLQGQTSPRPRTGLQSSMQGTAWASAFGQKSEGRSCGAALVFAWVWAAQEPGGCFALCLGEARASSLARRLWGRYPDVEKVEGGSLPSEEFAASSALRVGDPAQPGRGPGWRDVSSGFCRSLWSSARY